MLICTCIWKWAGCAANGVHLAASQLILWSFQMGRPTYGTDAVQIFKDISRAPRCYFCDTASRSFDQKFPGKMPRIWAGCQPILWPGAQILITFPGTQEFSLHRSQGIHGGPMGEGLLLCLSQASRRSCCSTCTPRATIRDLLDPR